MSLGLGHFWNFGSGSVARPAKPLSSLGDLSGLLIRNQQDTGPDPGPPRVEGGEAGAPVGGTNEPVDDYPVERRSCW